MQGDAQQPAAMTDEQIIAALVEAGLPVQRVTHAVTRREICTTRGSVEIGKIVAAARALLASQAQPQVPAMPPALDLQAIADTPSTLPCGMCNGMGFQGIPGARCRFCDGRGRTRLGAPPVPAQAAPSMEAHNTKLIEAADEHADVYEGQALPANEVRAAITNAFYAGSRFAHPTTAAPAGVPSDLALLDAIYTFGRDLSGWARAYPLAAFPEPDLAAARKALAAAGITLDAVSASAMRHAVTTLNTMFESVRLAARASSPSGASQEALTGDSKDAARYRWLRSDDIEVRQGQREICVEMKRLPFREDQSDEMLTGPELDAAIDAAMEQQHAQEQEGANHG